MNHPRRAALAGATAILALSAAGPAARAAQDVAAPAAAAPADVGSSGLLDPIGAILTPVLTGLGGVLNTLLGGSQLTALQGVTGALDGGAAPSATTLAPLTAWLTTVSGSAGVPAELQGTAAQVAALLTNPTAPGAALSVPALSSATSLLTQLQGTSGLSASGVSTLSGLVAALTAAAAAVTVGGDAPAALPIVGALPIGSTLLQPLQDVVTTLTGGAAPTGALLAPVADLLREVAALPALDSLIGASLTQLADQVDGSAGELGPELLQTLVSTLLSLGATPGVPAEIVTVIGSLTDILGVTPGTTPGTTTPGTTTPGTTTPGTTTPGVTRPVTGFFAPAAVGDARIAGLRVDRRLGRVRVSLACPARGPACRTLVAAYRGRLLEASSPVITIPAGATVKRSLRLDAATRRVLKRKTVRFRVSAVLPAGRLSTRSVTAKLPKVKKARRAVNRTAVRRPVAAR